MHQWADIGAAPAQPLDSRPTGSGNRTGTTSPGRQRATRMMQRHPRPALGALDAGGVLLQRHAREVLVGSSFVLLPVIALNLLVSSLVFDRDIDLDGAVVSVPEFVGGVDAATGTETLLAYVGILTASLAVALVGGYVASLVTAQGLGLPVTISSGMRTTVRRLPALGCAWLITHSWMFLGSLLLVKVSAGDLGPLGVMAVVLIAPLVAWFVVLAAFVSPAIVVEGLGPVAGVRRGIAVARLRSGTTWAFVTLTVVVGGGLRILLAWLPRLLELTGFVTFGRVGWLAEGLTAQLAQLVTVPLVAAGTAYCYFQQRIHAEGMDVTIAAQRTMPSGDGPT